MTLECEFDYHGSHVQIIGFNPPSGYFALVEKDGRNIPLMNPIRGDRFRHVWTCRKFAKSFLRGNRVPKPGGGQ